MTVGNLRLVSGPAVEPVSVNDVKLHTHVSFSEEDDLITQWIKSGRELAETVQRRAYITQTYDLFFDGFPLAPIVLPRPPLSSVSTIKYTDYLGVETTLYNSGSPVGTEDDFIIDISSQPGRIDLAWGVTWPSVVLRSINAVAIRFIAGYGDDGTTVPDNVKDAILLYCTYRYENRSGEISKPPDAFFSLLQTKRVF